MHTRAAISGFGLILLAGFVYGRKLVYYCCRAKALLVRKAGFYSSS